MSIKSAEAIFFDTTDGDPDPSQFWREADNPKERSFHRRAIAGLVGVIAVVSGLTGLVIERVTQGPDPLGIPIKTSNPAEEVSTSIPHIAQPDQMNPCTEPLIVTTTTLDPSIPADDAYMNGVLRQSAHDTCLGTK